jgi:succinoglycan biosynthesis protein ExoL|tara:strand:+ start:15969 stop:17111 length:1143 start_codon:yes stop_codon:yes gene_type:complete
MKNKTSVNMIFLISGSPVPAMLDMIIRSKNLGYTPLLIIIDRGESDLIVDDASVDYEVIKLKVDYSGKGSRLLSIISIYKILKPLLLRLDDKGFVMTSTYDLLFTAVILRLTRNFLIRHQVRDLHKLQLGNGLIPRLLRLIEKNMLKLVDVLITSSQGFMDSYYTKLFSGKVILLENVPPLEIWNGFIKKTKNNDEIIIGFIGILRYKKSIFALIDAVEALREKGKNVKVLFAGGSMGDDLKEIKSKITLKDGFIFSGPYKYSSDIQDLYKKIDIIYAIYDENDFNCKIAMPNKFYESIITGYPILVADNTFVGRQVEELGIGKAISISNKLDLEKCINDVFIENSWYKSAIEKLKDTKIINYADDYKYAMDESIKLNNK